MKSIVLTILTALVLVSGATCKARAEGIVRVDLAAHFGVSYFLTDKALNILDPKKKDPGLRIAIVATVLLGGLGHELLGREFGWDDLGADALGCGLAVVEF